LLAPASELLRSRLDLNAGAMFGERAGEPNREEVASPSRRKTVRGAAESRYAHQKYSGDTGVFLFYDLGFAYDIFGEERGWVDKNF
jgi:hypothetical protein